MVDLRNAVEGVREAVEALASEMAPDQAAVLRINLQDRRDLLARKIRQLSPSTLSVQVRACLAVQARRGSQLSR